jgi:hypothetical protein
MATAMRIKLVSTYTHSIQEGKQGFTFPATLRTLGFLHLFSFTTVRIFESKPLCQTLQIGLPKTCDPKLSPWSKLALFNTQGNFNLSTRHSATHIKPSARSFALAKAAIGG